MPILIGCAWANEDVESAGAASAGVAVFNPGSIGPRRFALPIVFGTIDITPGSIRLAHHDCATGAAWSPPGHAPGPAATP